MPLAPTPSTPSSPPKEERREQKRERKEREKRERKAKNWNKKKIECTSCLRGIVGCVEELMNELITGDEADGSVGFFTRIQARETTRISALGVA